MSTKELIQAELENLREEDLKELYEVVRRYAGRKQGAPREPGVLEKLMRIKIEGPEDFARNLDLYLSGEKQIATDENVR